MRKISTPSASTVYCYDKNGNMVKRGGSNISYTSYNLPSVINSGSNSSTLSYGAFRNRFKQIAVSGGAAETTLYVAGLFERVTRPSGMIEYRHHIPGGNGTAAIHTRRTSGVNSTYYVHADHLGSPELFTDNAGAALVRPSFAAYGERRDGTDWNGPPSAADLTAIGNISRSGFTGHEHLDSVGLIHMNGRVYDPVAGRFLSADPILAIGLSKDVNSYAYAWNDPLNVTDPTGLSDSPVVASCIGDYCGWAPRGNRPLGPGWVGPYGHPNPQPSMEVVWDGEDFGGRPELAGAPEVSLRTDIDHGRMLSEILVPGVAYYNLGNDAASQGRYLASFGWNTAGHLEVLGTLATVGIGGVVAETARGVIGVIRAAARSAAQGARLTQHLRQLEKYGAGGYKELANGRVRYYGSLEPARDAGTMAGRRLAREWDPATGATRTWHETIDSAGRTRIVRPETGGPKVHYEFDEAGNYVGSW